MKTPEFILTLTMILAPCIAANSNGQQVSTKPSTDPVAPTRSCTVEGGMSVCREVLPGEMKPAEKPTAQAATASDATAPKGRLLLLLDIPRDIFTRLADDPAKNREYHAKSSWNYQPAPPAPAGADRYKPLLSNGEAPWKYKPKETFAYTPKRDWSYNRDVFGRIWRQNIQHDTKVVQIPLNKHGTFLMPMAPVR